GLLLLLEVAFQMRFQRLDAVRLDVRELGGIAVHLPLEGELETDRQMLLHLLLGLLLPLEPGDLGLDQPLLRDRVVADDGDHGRVPVGDDLQDVLVDELDLQLAVLLAPGARQGGLVALVLVGGRRQAGQGEDPPGQHQPVLESIRRHDARPPCAKDRDRWRKRPPPSRPRTRWRRARSMRHILASACLYVKGPPGELLSERVLAGWSRGRWQTAGLRGILSAWGARRRFPMTRCSGSRGTSSANRDIRRRHGRSPRPPASPRRSSTSASAARTNFSSRRCTPEDRTWSSSSGPGTPRRTRSPTCAPSSFGLGSISPVSFRWLYG